MIVLTIGYPGHQAGEYCNPDVLCEPEYQGGQTITKYGNEQNRLATFLVRQPAPEIAE